MATLYVTEPEARVEKEYQRIIVTLEGEVIQSVPLNSLTEIVIMGFAGATTQALLTLLDHGIGLTFLTRTGKIRGRLIPAGQSNLPLRLNQYALQTSPEFLLALARQLILGKLNNYYVYGQRIFRTIQTRKANNKLYSPLPHQQTENNAAKQALVGLNLVLHQLQDAENLPALLGMEGIGSKHYFTILKAHLNWKQDLGFLKRQRRPPKDLINALLSFGYTLLTNSMVSALTIVGLDPEAGYLHANQRGRPSLALDLIEEFRPIIVDAIVARMVNQRIITERSLEEREDGQLLLTRKALASFFRQYHQRINTEVIHPFFKKKLTYLKCFEAQAVLLKKVIEKEEQQYIPFTWR